MGFTHPSPVVDMRVVELLVRPLFGLLLISLLSAFAFVDVAEADEIFVLKGGTVVRGYVMREEDDKLVIRLTGFAESGRVTIEKSQVVERYVARDPNKTTQPERQPDALRRFGA